MIIYGKKYQVKPLFFYPMIYASLGWYSGYGIASYNIRVLWFKYAPDEILA